MLKGFFHFCISGLSGFTFKSAAQIVWPNDQISATPEINYLKTVPIGIEIKILYRLFK